LSGSNASSNVVLSPFSLDTALGILALGAGGNTQKALRAVRALDGFPSESMDAEMKLQQSIRDASGTDLTVSIANSVWLKPKAEPRQAFVLEARAVFDAGVTNVDFSKSETLDAVNAWVSSKTHDVIPRVVDNLDPRNEFLLINTTYFKAKWASRFEPSATREMPFTRLDGSKHNVPMMHASLPLEYALSDEWHAVKIAYQGNRFEMRLLTSKQPVGSNMLKSNLGAVGAFNALVASTFDVQDVNLSLPRFRAEYGADLTPQLNRLGLAAALGRGANYRGITKVSVQGASLIQRTVVEVAEEGTQAAAATAVGATRSLEVPDPIAFSADRPFFFGIFDKETGAVLFFGYIADPVT
jgi:serine protease inhibitor